ncbi:glycosidase [Tepidanaerobacter acetatoxydans]|uniref:glycoside hydrolase family 130 protein n=1 Tax=Tepidanaerobacter acetatoxydans TaxID=499229 RepID=UPI00020C00B5|nr:glycosidase [Tepidanaerobacter acetatoxydans]AEE91797.1 glycosidase related protein [Tepidanaerobacter acetatoxydans Re1]
MGHIEILFKETVDRAKAELKSVKNIDIIIGIPFNDEKDALGNIITVAKNSLKTKGQKLIVCVGGPTDVETIKNIRERFGNEIAGFSLPSGVNGRGFGIRLILEIARLFKSDVILLETDLKSQSEQELKHDWVDCAADPIFGDYDISVACFRRYTLENIIDKILVLPLMTALYKTKFSDPFSGVAAITHDLVEEFCSEFDQNREYLGGYGINPWLITTALKWSKRICEVNLWTKISLISSDKKYIAAKEMLKSLFECIIRDEDIWLEDFQIIKTPDMYGSEFKDVPLKIVYNHEELLDSFIKGTCCYGNLLQKILSKKVLSYIEFMTISKDNVIYSPEIWSQAVYEFIVAYNFNSEIPQEDLLEALIAIYKGMLAALILEIMNANEGLSDLNVDIDTVVLAQTEAIYKNTVNAFMNNKSQFSDNWRQKLEETSPVLTPLDYLEFIPGVPIVLPKKLIGKNRCEAITSKVFKRLQKKYNNAFTSFLETLSIHNNASSEDICRCLTDFMADLENTIDSLCPGNLYSLEGTNDVVKSIFNIIPHSKVIAVKWEILRKLLYEYPPGNLILRMGFRNLRELLDNMNERKILTLASFTEDKDYFDRIFYWLKDNLRPDSFEEVEILPMVVNRNDFHGSSELREISDLNRLTAYIPVMNLGKGMGGNYPKLWYFTRIAKSIVEAEHFSDLWKTYTRERKEVGRKFVNSILGHYGKAVFSAHHIFENWHHRVLVSKLQVIADNLRKENNETDAKNIDIMVKGYGLSMVLNDGTFIPCSAWTWASFSFKGGDGIPTPLFLHVERDWFNHDLLEEIYKEMGYDSEEILQQVFQYISQGRESIDLAKALLGVKQHREQVIIQELDYWPKAEVLKRYSEVPILKPINEHWWENRFVLNTASLRIKDKVYLLYRAFGEDEISRIGLAISDGYRIIERLKEPIFSPEMEEEKKGCEDPRTVIIDDEIFMLYTAYDGVVAQIAAASITIDDFLNRKYNCWKRRGLAFPGLWDKDAILFPEKINGKYVIYHRIEPSIWIAYSPKLSFPWPRDGHKIIMGPRSGMMWDSLKIGAGAQPIKTRYGWLLIYHGVDKDMVYRLGVMLADLKDPGRLLYRSPNPTLSPETKCEVGEKDKCWVPNVVFTCGAVAAEDKEILDIDDEILVYYGAADTYICLATGTVGDMIPAQVRERIDNRR